MQAKAAGRRPQISEGCGQHRPAKERQQEERLATYPGASRGRRRAPLCSRHPGRSRQALRESKRRQGEHRSAHRGLQAGGSAFRRSSGSGLHVAHPLPAGAHLDPPLPPPHLLPGLLLCAEPCGACATAVQASTGRQEVGREAGCCTGCCQKRCQRGARQTPRSPRHLASEAQRSPSPAQPQPSPSCSSIQPQPQPARSLGLPSCAADSLLFHLESRRQLVPGRPLRLHTLYLHRLRRRLLLLLVRSKLGGGRRLQRHLRPRPAPYLLPRTAPCRGGSGQQQGCRQVSARHGAAG